MTWDTKHENGLWYAVSIGGRIPIAILRHSLAHAEETARALNRIDTYHEAPASNR
ncbi:MAG TPA: hypothetical protein VK573_02790 [Gemmatimonadales bacterium]|nr:hypothetical protein [Gemmatimonadales bacterium]